MSKFMTFQEERSFYALCDVFALSVHADRIRFEFRFNGPFAPAVFDGIESELSVGCECRVPGHLEYQFRDAAPAMQKEYVFIPKDCSVFRQATSRRPRADVFLWLIGSIYMRSMRHTVAFASVKKSAFATLLPFLDPA